MNNAAILNILIKTKGAREAARDLAGVDAEGRRAEGGTTRAASGMDKASAAAASLSSKVQDVTAATGVLSSKNKETAESMAGTNRQLKDEAANAEAAAANLDVLNSSAAKLAQLGKIKAELGANVDTAAFAKYEEALQRAHRRAKDEKSFRAALGADFDPNAFDAYHSAVEKTRRDNNGLRSSFGGLNSNLINTNQGFTGLRNAVSLVKMPAFIAMAGTAVQALNALTAGAVALVSALAPVSGVAVAGAAGLTALAQAGGTAALAFMGVGDALKEQLQLHTKMEPVAKRAANTEVSTAAAVKAAQEGVRAAKEGVRTASLSVADALRNEKVSSEGVTRAQEGVRDATEGLAEAQKAAKDAQKALSMARQEAIRDIQNMRDAVVNAVWGERDAIRDLHDAQEALAKLLKPASVLDLADAQDAVADSGRNQTQAQLSLTDAQAKYNATMADATTTAQERAQALLDVQNAENAVGDATRGTFRAQESLDKLQKGPSKNEIADARYNIAKAEKRVSDAVRAREQAQGSLNQAERLGVNGSAAVVNAKNAIADADRGVVQAERSVTSAQRGVIDAQRTVADAHRATIEARHGLANATRQVTLAEAGVRDAQKKTASSSGVAAAAAQNLSAKFDALPPAAQRFVRVLQGLKPRMDELRATAAAGLFPGVIAGIHAAMKNFGVMKKIVGDTAGVLGGLAKRAGELVGSKGFGRDLATIGDRNVKVIGHLGNAGLNFANVMRHLIVAAGPLTGWLSRMVEKWSELTLKQTKAGRESGRLAGFFDKTRNVLSHLFSIVGHVASAFFQIGKAAAPLGHRILVDIDKLSAKFEAWTKSMEGKRSLAKYFKDAKAPLYEIAGLVGDVVKAFFGMSPDKTLTPTIKKLRDLVPVLKNMAETTAATFTPTLIDALSSFVKLFAQLAGSSGPLTVYVKLLGLLADALTAFISSNPAVHSMTVSLIGLVAVLKSLQIIAKLSGLTMLIGSLGSLRAASQAAMVAQAEQTALTLRQRAVLLVTTAATAAYTAAQWLLNLAMSANPILLIVAGLAALGAAFYLAYKKIGPFHDAVDKAWDILVSLFNWAKDHWPLLLAILAGPFGLAALAIVKHLETIKAVAAAAWAALKTGAVAAWGAIGKAADIAWTAIKAYITAPIQAAKLTVIAVLWSLNTGMSTVWSAMKKAVFAAWDKMRDWALGAWRAVRDLMPGVLSGLYGFMSSWFSTIKTLVFRAWDQMRDWALGAWRAVRDLMPGVLTGLFNNLHTGFSVILKGIGGWASDIKNKVVDIFKDVAGRVVDFIGLIIRVINLIPGVDIKFDAGELKKKHGLARGGVFQGGSGGGEFARGGAFARTGGKVAAPITLMGEEAPRYPEYVIPTNPAYRGRAQALTAQAAQAVGMANGGVIGLAEGGVISAFRKAITDRGADAKSALALFEAGIVESGLRNLPGGLDDSVGAVQQRASQGWHGLRDPYAAAMEFLAHAMPISRSYGTAGQLAQAVQRSAFPDRYDAVRTQALHYFKGDLGDLLAAATNAIGDVLGKLPGVSGLPDWLQGTGRWILDKAKDFIASKAHLFGGGGAGDIPLGGPPAGSPPGKVIAHMAKAMDAIDAKNWPYVYGGGHGSFQGPYDCSGLVSAILHAGGWLGSPITTDGLKVFGDAGDGRYITIGVRGSTGANAHTMMKLGNRYLESGSGHGAKWVSGWSGGFPIHRHPTGYAQGGMFPGVVDPGKFDPQSHKFVGWGLAKGGPYVGSYANGGVVPQTGFAQVHKGETITPAGDSGALVMALNRNTASNEALVSSGIAGVVAALADGVNGQLGSRAGLGLMTPSSPGQVARH